MPEPMLVSINGQPVGMIWQGRDDEWFASMLGPREPVDCLNSQADAIAHIQKRFRKSLH